jgi:transcriptional regulator with XRE-family HTH domain
MSPMETRYHVALCLSRHMHNERSIQRFGEKLRTLRVQHDLTLKQLANELGLTAHGYISELEAGKKMPTAEFVLNVARLFDVTTDELLKDELELENN